ncbi:MAG: thiamine pyrophosphokinae [Acidimicrobiaceae bacterium]
MGHRSVVVVAGGERASPLAPLALPANAVVIAADSGVDHAYAMGLCIDVAIGDFDSISQEGLARAESDGVRIERHPAAKDLTDLELALDEALRVGADELVVLGIGGGRLDHLTANLLLLASPKFAACRITALDGPVRVHVVHGGHPATVLPGEVGELLTLLPIGSAASGITTEGLRYPLRREVLAPGTSRGVSNVVDASPPSVQLEAGTLLAIFPGQGDNDA